MRYAIVTNIPVPYRNPVWSRLPQDDYAVIFCARNEPNRHWQLAEPKYRHIFLAERVKHLKDGFNYVHNNPDIWPLLNRLKPEVIVCTGLNPTHLYAFGWAKTHGAKYIYMTDATEESEKILGWKHRLLRHAVIRSSAGAIVASKSGSRVIKRYGMADDHIHFSRLCADNDSFQTIALGNRPFDVMFCGQLHERKLPYFFSSVCKSIREKKGSCSALVVGDGPEREQFLEELNAAGINVDYKGFVQPAELPQWYPQAKLFLFTTRMDPWGVVANEAMASGTPVITTPYAGVADDLVIDGSNGRVIPVDVGKWSEACLQLLEDEALWHSYSRQALADVRQFNYDSAARGLQAACEQAFCGS